MREHYDGRGFRKPREIRLHPGDLLGSYHGPSRGHIVERDEMNAAMVERVMRRAHELAEHVAAVESGVVLARHYLQLRAANLARDLLEQFEALGVLVGRVSVVGQIAGNYYQLGSVFQPVDSSDGAFECLGAERVRWSVESDVRIAQLNERERSGSLAIELGESARDSFGASFTR